MVPIGGLAVVLCVIPIMASAQQDPLAWFPLQVGSRWIYAHEWKSGDRNRPSIDRWTTQETVIGRVTVPEGLVVLREVKLRDYEQPGVIHSSYLNHRDREPYLVHGNCIYVIGNGWDGERQELRPEYRKYLTGSAVSPDFCFPLQIGREWGNADVPWRVEPADLAGAMHIFSSHFGSGGSEDVWFQRGVGVAREHYIHHGTYDEYTKRLLSFLR